ncbi:uncharacterized protein TNCV_3930801 [Trichonephila clavipes]|nr:uncharacterized protein TNCV_3930801 [Trichonephila clavipes]
MFGNKKVVAKFKPKFEGPHRVLEFKNNNVVIWKEGKGLTVNVDQVRIYRHRKCDKMEIRTGSSDSNSSRHKSSSFESVQWSSNESQYDQDEKPTGRTDKRGPLIRSPPGSWSEHSRKLKISRKETIGYTRWRDSGSGGPESKQRKRQNHHGEKRQLTLTSNSELQGPRKKYGRDEIVMPSTSGYNLKPRRGTKMKSRPTIEMRAQQGGPVRDKKRRENHYSP